MKVVIRSTQTKVQDFPIISPTEVEISDDATIADLRALIARMTGTNSAGIKTILSRGQVHVDHTRLSTLAMRGSLDFTFAYNKAAVRVDENGVTEGQNDENIAVVTANESATASASASANDNIMAEPAEPSSASSGASAPASAASANTTSPSSAQQQQQQRQPEAAAPRPTPQRHVINNRVDMKGYDDDENEWSGSSRSGRTAGAARTERDFIEFVNSNKELKSVLAVLSYEPSPDQIDTLCATLGIQREHARCCLKLGMGNLEMAGAIAIDGNEDELRSTLDQLKTKVEEMRASFLRGEDVQFSMGAPGGNIPIFDFARFIKSLPNGVISAVVSATPNTSKQMEDAEKSIEFKGFLECVKITSPDLLEKFNGNSIAAFELKRDLFKFYKALSFSAAAALQAAARGANIGTITDRDQDEPESAGHRATSSPAPAPRSAPASAPANNWSEEPARERVASPAPARPARTPEVQLTEQEKQGLKDVMEMLGVNNFEMVANTYATVCNRNLDLTATFIMDNLDMFFAPAAPAAAPQQSTPAAPAPTPITQEVPPTAPVAPAPPTAPVAPSVPEQQPETRQQLSDESNENEDDDSEEML